MRTPRKALGTRLPLLIAATLAWGALASGQARAQQPADKPAEPAAATPAEKPAGDKAAAEKPVDDKAAAEKPAGGKAAEKPAGDKAAEKPAGERAKGAPAPYDRNAGFVPAGPNEQESVPGGTLLVVAYAIVWGLLMAYLIAIWRRQSRLQQELDHLARRVADQR